MAEHLNACRIWVLEHYQLQYHTMIALWTTSAWAFHAHHHAQAEAQVYGACCPASSYFVRDAFDCTCMCKTTAMSFNAAVPRALKPCRPHLRGSRARSCGGLSHRLGWGWGFCVPAAPSCRCGGCRCRDGAGASEGSEWLLCTAQSWCLTPLQSPSA